MVPKKNSKNGQRVCIEVREELYCYQIISFQDYPLYESQCCKFCMTSVSGMWYPSPWSCSVCWERPVSDVGLVLPAGEITDPASHMLGEIALGCGFFPRSDGDVHFGKSLG